MTALAQRKTCAAEILDALKSKIDESAFDAWIRPLAVSEKESKIILAAASRFNADFIKATFGAAIAEIETAFGVEINVSFGRPQLRIIENRGQAQAQAAAPRVFDFDDFIPSDPNQFAMSAVKKCAAGKVSFSPLVIYGPTGSGKSLLAGLLKNNSSGRALMTTGAEFVSDFVRAMQSNALFAFKDRMRMCDVFIMDDVQNLAGKRASAEEFLVLVDDLIKMGKNVVLTSDIAPSQITGFDKRLVSILASGLSVDLSAPDSIVRAKILEKSGVAESIAKTIAARTPANGHIMSGIAKKIAAWRELESGELSEAVLEKLLADVLLKQNTPLSMVKNCAAKLGVAFDDIMSKTRTKAVVFARQKIMAALKQSTELTLAEIGRLVGDRDHASVLYALAQIEKAKETDMLLESEIRDLI